MSQLTQEHLKTQLHYDPLTGALSWLVNRGPARAGSVIRTKNKQYLSVMLGGKNYLQHKIAWLYMTGYYPAVFEDIDHINRDRGDNTWSNLRLCTRAQNQCNTLAYSNNTSGFKGVSFCTTNKVWRAQVLVNGVSYSSTHNTKEAAALAATNLRNKLHGEFANHGIT